MVAKEPVEIGEVGNCRPAQPWRSAFSDLLDGGVQVRLAAACDEDVGSFGHEALGGGEADAAVAAGDEGDFTVRVYGMGSSS